MHLLYPACCVLLLLGYVAFRAGRNKYQTPLRHVPSASKLAPLSRYLWAFPQEWTGNLTLELPRLHERLGPLVRIGPNEVSFYSLEVYDLVHKVGSGFSKDPRIYGEFVQDGHPALFSITNGEEHAKRRRLMGQLFNRGKIDNLNGLMLDQIRDFITAIRSRHIQSLNLVPACRALEADIVSAFGFGRRIGAIETYFRGEELAMVAKNDEKATWMPLLTNLPTVCWAMQRLEKMVYAVVGWQTDYTKAMDAFDSWSSSALRSLMIAEKPSPSAFPNFIQCMVKSGLAPQSALSEAKEMLGPGTDTTSASLAHILWALAHNPEYQEELYQDLLAADFPADINSLEAIPRLRACVKEGIRWTGAAAAMLPRIVPPAGVELFGRFLPGGTVISSSPIWYLHDRTAYPNPEKYDPYRWLTSGGATESQDLLRDRYYIPFSKGSYICIGAHFAYLELYLSVSQMLRSFRLTVDPSVQSPSPTPSVLVEPNAKFNRVTLPARREWVAAVPSDQLLIVLHPRGD